MYRNNYLTDEDKERYQRQILIDTVGEEGQKKIKNSRIIIIGCGGLGSPAALYLAASGVGTLGICDKDIVNVSNLQRQIIYTEKNIGEKKAHTAKKRLNKLNSKTNIVSFDCQINEHNIEGIIKDFDIVIDASDNFKTRYIVSDACVKQNKCDIYGAVMNFSGQVAVLGHEGPCLRCLNPEERDTETPKGILSPICGIIGSLQATVALKIVLGMERDLQGKMFFYDGLSDLFEVEYLKKNTKCQFCINNLKRG